MIKKLVSYDNLGNLGTTIITNDEKLILDESLDWADITDHPEIDKILSTPQDFKIQFNKDRDIQDVIEKTDHEKKELEKENGRRKIAIFSQAQQGAVAFRDNISSVQDTSRGSAASTKSHF